MVKGEIDGQEAGKDGDGCCPLRIRLWDPFQMAYVCIYIYRLDVVVSKKKRCSPLFEEDEPSLSHNFLGMGWFNHPTSRGYHITIYLLIGDDPPSNSAMVLFGWSPLESIKLRDVEKDFISWVLWGIYGTIVYLPTWKLKTIPSRKLTYPTWGKGISSSNTPYQGDMLIPWRVNLSQI